MTKKPKDCTFCEHAVAIHDPVTQNILYECRRFPPTPFILTLPGRIQGAPPQMIKQSAYPSCIDPCGEFILSDEQPVNDDDKPTLIV